MYLRSLLRVAVPAAAVGLICVIQAAYFRRGFFPGDSFTYLSAGERLNAGHLLYALSPGDRLVDLQPPYWTVPLLSPPPIAVLFRPFALLSNAGAYVWWFICIAMVVGTCAALIRKRPITTGLAMIVLSVPLVYEIGVGNLNAWVLAGLTGSWYLMARRRDAAGGAVLALVTALKLTPAIMAWWIITQHRWGALRSFLVAGIATVALSIAGAGLAAHIEYLSIVRQTSTVGSSVLSLAGLARTGGIPDAVAALLPAVALATGVFFMWLLRTRPGAAWAVGIVTLLAASPVVNINWFALLLAALAPLAWPMEAEPSPAPIAETAVVAGSPSLP